MTESSDPERLLRDIVTGGVSPDSDRADELFRKHPELRERLEQLRSMAAGFDELGSLRAEVLDEIADLPRTPGVAARDVLASHLPTRQARPKPGLPWWITTAAVASLFLGLWLAGFFDPSPNVPGVLGSDIRDLWPEGNVRGVVEFRWSYDLPRGGWYDVSVYRAGDRVTYVPDLTEGRWTPTTEETREWKGTLRWKVEAFSADTTLEATGERVIQYERE